MALGMCKSFHVHPSEILKFKHNKLNGSLFFQSTKRNITQYYIILRLLSFWYSCGFYPVTIYIAYIVKANFFNLVDCVYDQHVVARIGRCQYISWTSKLSSASCWEFDLNSAFNLECNMYKLAFGVNNVGKIMNDMLCDLVGTNHTLTWFWFL